MTKSAVSQEEREKITDKTYKLWQFLNAFATADAKDLHFSSARKQLRVLKTIHDFTV